MRVLLAHGDVNPDEPDKGSQIPLWWAAYMGHEGVVKLLLARDEVNPDKPDVFGRTPLWGATDNGHERVVKFLLGQGDANQPGETIQVEHSGALQRAVCGDDSSASLLSPSSVA